MSTLENQLTRGFDIRGPLPTGVTMLEASAGTGKTYAIAALAARYVAEGTPLEQILLVTFTRMATGELRERVRERLVDVERALKDQLAGGTATHPDHVVQLLAAGPEDVVRERHRRITRALATFDSATIATTHAFCQEVLGGLGIAGDLDRETAFVEDLTDLTDEALSDLYVRRFWNKDDAPLVGFKQASEIARVAVGNQLAPIVEATGDIAVMRTRLAQAVRDEVDFRKRRQAVMTHDDLLTRLDEALKGLSGDVIVERLRARFSVVLVDEFQDTDLIQWGIFQRAFDHPGIALVLIGDPKQAIYAFRGADVHAYLRASQTAGTRATLDTNWRSDAGLINAYDAMFVGAKLGHEGIVYRAVEAATANQTARLHGAPEEAPLRVRVVHRTEPAIYPTRTGYPTNASAREHIAADLAHDLVKLLASGATLEQRADDGTTLNTEVVCPGHVAVLVRTNRHASLIRDALDAVGIPAVINGAGSVFGTPAAKEWLRLLEAIERPASPTRARAAALTAFFGWTADDLAAASEDDWSGVHRRLHDWGRRLRADGVATLTETITLLERLPERVLSEVDGERALTDLRHVGQLLHAAAAGEQIGTTALTAWLRKRVLEAEQDTADEERSRRLESDAEAVQVLTIHRSKGLEFPVVYLPYLWEPGYIPDGRQPIFFHDREHDEERVIDVSLEGPAFTAHQKQHVAEQRGEELRLAYVALTRAKHQAVLWWAGTYNARESPLGRLLFARDEDGTVRDQADKTPGDGPAMTRFEKLAAAAPGCISVERSVVDGLAADWSPLLEAPSALDVASFDRTLDWGWRRTSYSDVTAGTYEPRVGSEPEDVVLTDEPEDAEPALVVDPGSLLDESLRGVPSLLAEMNAGTAVGTLVHQVFEAADFAASDLRAEIARCVAVEQARRPVDLGSASAVVEGLAAAIETPLGPVVGGIRLRDVARADRLDELGFELPLAGGDSPTGEVTLAAIRRVLRKHLPAGDPLAGYADRLEDARLRQQVRGYLTGSLDLVVRVPGDGGVPRFAVIDYKTNRLGSFDEELTAWHHRPAALVAEMHHAHYGLQAILYTAALHRYLRWRVADYSPEKHLAGVLYLFLRGMSGADNPTIDGEPCGVFAWQPPAPLVLALSDVLDGTGGSAA